MGWLPTPIRSNILGCLASFQPLQLPLFSILISPVTTASSALDQGRAGHIGNSTCGYGTVWAILSTCSRGPSMSVTVDRTCTPIQANLNHEASPLPGEILGVNGYQGKGVLHLLQWCSHLQVSHSPANT